MRLKEVVDTVIESDLPAVEKITFDTLEKCKKLLMIIAENVPLQPNVDRLAVSLGTTRDTLLKLLYKLDKAEILELLTVKLKNYKKLVNPEKIYLGNTNLMYALSPEIEVGTLRATFFIDQFASVGTVQMTHKGDFLVNGKYLFEVGGDGKSFDQIADIPDSYLTVDGHRTTRADYVAKNDNPNTAAPKIFFRYYYVNSSTGEKSGTMLAECKWTPGA